MLNIALVGAGRHSTKQHAPALQHLAATEHHRVRLAAVCDLQPRKADEARDRFGFARSVYTIDALITEVRPDAVVLVMPIALIVPVALQFIDLGVPVLIEKPMGGGLEEARRLARAAEGARVMVSLNRRFDPGVRLALEWARERGPVRAVHGVMRRHRRNEADFLWGTGVHLLDLLCHVAGPRRVDPAQVFAPEGCWRAGRLIGDGPETTFEIFPTCGRNEECLRMAGEGYCADVWTGFMGGWRVEAWADGRPGLSASAPMDQPEFFRDGVLDETRAFVDAVVNGTPLFPTPADAMPATEAADALQRMIPQDKGIIP